MSGRYLPDTLSLICSPRPWSIAEGAFDVGFFLSRGNADRPVVWRGLHRYQGFGRELCEECVRESVFEGSAAEVVVERITNKRTQRKRKEETRHKRKEQTAKEGTRKGEIHRALTQHIERKKCRPRNLHVKTEITTHIERKKNVDREICM